MRVPIILASLGACAVLSACSSSSESDIVQRGAATLHSVTSDSIGYLQLAEHENGDLDVVVHVEHVAPGKHGIHFHSIGMCDPSTSFGSTGAHFNPLAKKHGLLNPDGAHAGDLPNVEVRPDSTGDLTTMTQRTVLGNGTLSLMDNDLSAVVLHAGEDDQVTDPMGNSGARIACGVIDLVQGQGQQSP